MKELYYSCLSNYSLHKHKFYAINIYIYIISHPIAKMYPRNIVRVFLIQYSYTLTFKNKSKIYKTSINCQQ